MSSLAITNGNRGTPEPARALVVEDLRLADIVLTNNHGVVCTRITHSEFQGSTGQTEFEKLLNGNYAILWVSTPKDYHIQQKRAINHGQKVVRFVNKAAAMKMLVIMFGPPSFLWKDASILKTIEENDMIWARMRCCNIGAKYDQNNPTPSGTYFFMATNVKSKAIHTKAWGCNCGVPIEKHILDWKGRSEDLYKWKKTTTHTFAELLMKTIMSSPWKQRSQKTLLNLVDPGHRIQENNCILDNSGSPLPTESTETAFPTESRMKQKVRLKEMKEKGEKPKKKKIYTEPGNDDCGDDLSSLGKDIIYLSYDIFDDNPDTDIESEELYHLNVPVSIPDGETNIWSAVATLCYGKHNKVDLVELCGGAGRISTVAFRRGLISGGNLDLVTGCDLGDPATQKAINHYFNVCHVLVAVLQPNCRTTGRNSYYNWYANHGTWKKHHEQDLPHIQYCGHIALTQIKKKRFFIREQPAGTWIDHIPPWTEVWKDEAVICQTMDQCMAGCVDSKGVPVKKMTEWVTNHEDLTFHLARFVCNQLHTHSHPTGKELEKLKLYPWKMCNAVVSGILRLKANLSKSIYPTTHAETQVDPGDRVPGAAATPRGGGGCPACWSNLRADCPLHTRVPMKCLHPNETPKVYGCKACDDYTNYRNPQGHDAGHNRVKGKCRFWKVPDPSPISSHRTGAHPREPVPPASSHPSSDTGAYDASLPSAPEQPSSSSGSGGPGDRIPDPPRGPDTTPRTRRTYADTGSGDSRLPTWNEFNVQNNLRNLRSYDPAVVTKELRKLHLRWWHAKEPKMRVILKAVGLDEVRLNMIKPIVDTCRECRAWAKKGNAILPSHSLSLNFLDEGEMDLMFYKTFTAFHCIDRCIRLSGSAPSAGKESAHIIEAYTTAWIQHHGPFKILYCDGESGVHCPEGEAEIRRLGSTLRKRAPHQHARVVERRNAVLRHVMHMIEADLKRSSHDITFKRLLAEATFVVNCFSFYNGVSPYNALTGRQPPFLPDFDTPDFPPDASGNKTERADHAREIRIREAARQAIIQSTAVAKVNRSLKGKTTVDGSRLYNPGELVDVHRDQPKKDYHGGWSGPYSVVSNEPDRGRITFQDGANVRTAVYAEVRHTLYIETLLALEANEGMDNKAMQTVLDYIGNLPAGKAPELFGYSAPNGELTTATKRAPKVFMALQYVVKSFFKIDDVIAVRVGNSIHQLPSYSGADSSVVIYYYDDNDPQFKYYETKDTAVELRQITSSTKSKVIQCIVKAKCKGVLEADEDIAKEMFTPGADPGDRIVPEEEEEQIPDEPASDSGRLSTIEEGDEEDVDLINSYYLEIEKAQYEMHQPDDNLLQPVPVDMQPEGTVLITTTDENPEDPGNRISETVQVHLSDDDPGEDYPVEQDEIGEYVEMCFTTDMAPVILDEAQIANLKPGEIATLRVYISANTKRAVVVKEDDLLSKKEIEQNHKAVAEAITHEIKIWLDNGCFKVRTLKGAQNLMTSRYVAKWKFVKQADGSMKRIIRMRLVLRGFQDTEAFDLDTFAGTAKRQSQRIAASQAACNPGWIIASLDIEKAFLQGLTYKELAEATGEKERLVCFKLPPGSAEHLRKFRGFEHFDESIHCLECIKPGTGTKDAPRAFSLKLRQLTEKIGLMPTIYDPEFEMKKGLLTAKHVDDINMTGEEKEIDKYTVEVEKVFGKCKLNKHQFTNCGVQYTKEKNGDVILDQDAYIKTLRPIVHPELTGKNADDKATKAVADLFVSLRGALAYTTLTQCWIQVFIVNLQRIQEPTNLDVRKLNAVTRKLQQSPQKLVYVAMKPNGCIDLHSDSGYRRIDKAEDEHIGYGMRGLCLCRRGVRVGDRSREQDLSKTNAVHLIDSICKSHRLTIRSSYGAELLAASHGFDDSYPTIVTLIELDRQWPLTPVELKTFREAGGWPMDVTLILDAESVFKSVTSRDLKTPTEKTLLGHICWIREALKMRLITRVRWCDTRDMIADGHTKGSIDRTGLLEAMSGKQTFKHVENLKTYEPHRVSSTASSECRINYLSSVQTDKLV